ncbi:MAG TPA: alkaline phosphatase family protein [Solirubrobacteraceae bacterium]|nr:alkaline phosphatase family protein [Solirubrobacteraceae bacterium]
MIKRLRSIRLTWPQIAIVAASSALSTGVVIHAATGRDSVPNATLSALRGHVVVHTLAAKTAAPPAAVSSAASTSTPSLADTSPSPSAPLDSGATTDDSATTNASNTTDGTDGGDVGTTDTTTPATTTPSSTASPVKYVFVIALTTDSYGAAFGQGSVAHYLNGTLRRRGTLLSGYHTLGGTELPDYLAMISGQAPNADTTSNCATYAEFSSTATAQSNGQIPGPGCVYPNTTLTIADQVTAAGKQWKAYIAGMGSSACVHADSNAADDTQLTGADSDYDTRHNPFVYFHSLLDLGGCQSNDIGIQHLTKDLRVAKRTPTYAYIAPGLCDEPSATSCAGTEPVGLAAEDAFLKRWVPQILASQAYKQDGALMIVFADAKAATDAGAAGDRPVRTGALILSPLAHKGKTVSGSYGPYSVLRTIEGVLGYTPLVHAKGARSFATAVLPGA